MIDTSKVSGNKLINIVNRIQNGDTVKVLSKNVRWLRAVLYDQGVTRIKLIEK